jgi:hypothetical protein
MDQTMTRFVSLHQELLARVTRLKGIQKNSAGNCDWQQNCSDCMREDLDMAESQHTFALPAGIPATNQDFEKRILDRLQHDLAELVRTLWQLFLFYENISRNDLSAGVINVLMQYCEEPERRAYCYLILGQLAEKDRQYTAALVQYARGLELKPNDQRTLYFLYQ